MSLGAQIRIVVHGGFEYACPCGIRRSPAWILEWVAVGLPCGGGKSIMEFHRRGSCASADVDKAKTRVARTGGYRLRLAMGSLRGKMRNILIQLLEYVKRSARHWVGDIDMVRNVVVDASN